MKVQNLAPDTDVVVLTLAHTDGGTEVSISRDATGAVFVEITEPNGASQIITLGEEEEEIEE